MTSNPFPSSVGSRLPSPFYERDTRTVATELLGHYLILNDAHQPKIGIISETEAYPGITDKASHSARGRTARTEVLFGPAGYYYVYLIYGRYYCFNIVTDAPETGGAVLIRAVNPVAHLSGKTTGPGLVCQAYGIDKGYNGQSSLTSQLGIYENKALDNDQQPLAYVSLPRVGIDYAGPDKNQPYRFRIAESRQAVYHEDTSKRQSAKER